MGWHTSLHARFRFTIAIVVVGVSSLSVRVQMETETSLPALQLDCFALPIALPQRSGSGSLNGDGEVGLSVLRVVRLTAGPVTLVHTYKR